MYISELFKEDEGKEVLLSGNEAFARGIFEAGVRFAANYPGTPVSEVGDYLHFLSQNSDEFTFDYSLNEKVALESCIGASWAGIRSVAMFKHLGLNVAADPLHTFPYSGINGGMLILCGGDPGILSSTNAQDNRLYSLHTKIPIIEPATVQECKDFIKEGLRFSELYNIPVYVHVTTRLCHSYGKVTLGKIELTPHIGKFKKNPQRYVNTLSKAMANQTLYFEKIAQVAKNKKLYHLFNEVKLIKNGNGKIDDQNKGIGVLTSGICYSYVLQACHKLGLNPPVLKLGMIFPINRSEICHFADQFDLNKLLVVEELEPLIETFSKEVFCNFCDVRRNIEIHGKSFLPKIGELNTDLIMEFLANHFSVQNTYLLEELKQKEKILSEIIPDLPIREPTFCSGCQYRPFFYALKKVTDQINEETGLECIFGGDIGCYTLGESYPYQLIDWVICMGAGIGIANGMSLVLEENQKLIAFIGDSTLFHTGLQPLLNAIKNDIDITIVIFNNYWTAMTGHQQMLTTPKRFIDEGSSKSKTDKKVIDLVNLVKSLGIKDENLVITGAYNIEKLERILNKTLKGKGTRVIILNEECALEKKRRLKRLIHQEELERKEKKSYFITDTCVKCNECIEILGCPAINAIFSEKGKAGEEDIYSEEVDYYIDEAKCVPELCPGMCKSVCKNNAIKKTILFPKKDNS